MEEYISLQAVLDIVMQYCPDDDGSCSKADVDLREMLDEIEALPIADVQLVISGDNCIVCGRNARKDNVYYDVNGRTICESCMNTKCKGTDSVACCMVRLANDMILKGKYYG